jgi:hypothetical protein
MANETTLQPLSSRFQDRNMLNRPEPNVDDEYCLKEDSCLKTCSVIAVNFPVKSSSQPGIQNGLFPFSMLRSPITSLMNRCAT